LIPNAERLQILLERARRTARTSFIAFYRYLYPGFDVPWHFARLADAFQGLGSDGKKLAVSLPPGHGKSFLTNLYVAWKLGTDPECRVIITSYSDRLARRNCQAIRTIVESQQFIELFPKVRVDKNQSLTSKEMHLKDYGGYVLAEPAGGQITGFRADLLVIDDPYKGMRDARSNATNESIKEWYDSTFRSRGNEKTLELVVHTRWQPDDLIGYLTERESDWKVLKLPALREPNNDPLDPRGPDESLWPAMVSTETLLQRRNQNPYVFSALYQQRPSNGEGEMLRRDWLQNRWSELPESVDRVVQSWDLRAGGTGSGSSYAVGQLWLQSGPNAYLVDQVRGRWSFPETLKQMELKLTDPLWSQASTVLVENKADGRAAIPVLKLKFAGITPVEPKGSKEERLSATTAYWASGNVILPARAEWLPIYLEELASFPLSANDDQMDATTQSLEFLFNKAAFSFFI
jgi:predicted phage terminase large subunit-like protein